MQTRPAIRDSFGPVLAKTSLGTSLQEQWRAVLYTLPKKVPKQLTTAMHAELCGMQRAHATLSRIVQRWQGTGAGQHMAAAVSQPHANPQGDEPPVLATQGPASSPGDDLLHHLAQGEQEAVEGRLHMNHLCNDQPLPVSPNTVSAAPEAVAPAVASMADHGLSQELQHGWTAEASQPRCRTAAAPLEGAAVHARTQEPTTPIRQSKTRHAATSPPCIPDTPSDSEGLPCSQPVRTAMADLTQACTPPGLHGFRRRVCCGDLRTR